MKRFDEIRFGTVGLRRRPGVYAILPLGNQVLLTWQGGIHCEFQLPGGGVDPKESPIAALHREVLEETGWTIAKPRLLTRYARRVYMPEYQMNAEKVCSIYLARPCRKVSDPAEAEHEPALVGWDFALDNLATGADQDMLLRFFRDEIR